MNGNGNASGFVPSIPDVPLPEAFEVDPTTGSFFDSAEGRISEMYAAGFKSPEEVKDFYEEVMPQFGWKKIDQLTYQKEGEILTIEPEKGKYLTTIKYNLRPNT